MTNQIKHNSPSSVLSQFNPVASLKPRTRRQVNEKFIKPILEAFFEKKGMLDNFSELDPDKLITEVEFLKKGETESLIKTFIYKEIINDISKQGKRIIFKPKYVITFDEELTNYSIDESLYPYKSIFKTDDIEETNIKYGVIRLGEAPILYYILIDLQKIIKYIKNIPEDISESEINKLPETELEIRNRLLDKVIFDKQQQLKNTNISDQGKLEQEIKQLEKVRLIPLQGKNGKLRINLAWNTTDDLDLYIESPNGIISYKNKVIEHNGVIGVLDIDQNASNNVVSNPQENINFDNVPIGLHKISVNFYLQRESSEVPFTITVIPENGEGRIFNSIVKGKGNTIDIAKFEYINGSIEYIELLN